MQPKLQTKEILKKKLKNPQELSRFSDQSHIQVTLDLLLFTL